MNQMYFVPTMVGMSLMSMLYAYSLQPVHINQGCSVSMNESVYMVKFQYCRLLTFIKNFMSAYE